MDRQDSSLNSASMFHVQVLYQIGKIMTAELRKTFKIPSFTPMVEQRVAAMAYNSRSTPERTDDRVNRPLRHLGIVRSSSLMLDWPDGWMTGYNLHGRFAPQLGCMGPSHRFPAGPLVRIPHMIRRFGTSPPSYRIPSMTDASASSN